MIQKSVYGIYYFREPDMNRGWGSMGVRWYIGIEILNLRKKPIKYFFILNNACRFAYSNI